MHQMLLIYNSVLLKQRDAIEFMAMEVFVPLAIHRRMCDTLEMRCLQPDPESLNWSPNTRQARSVYQSSGLSSFFHKLAVLFILVLVKNQKITPPP